MSRQLVCIIVACIAILPVHALTESVDGITWTYTVANGVASIGGGSSDSPAVRTSTSGAITIPSTLGGYPVTSIGYSAFRECSRLTSVTIPNRVTNIGASAFSRCSGLTSVTIPNSVTNIGDRAFSSCSGLTSVTIPASVTSIGDSAFFGCSGLTSVTIPASVTSIGDSAFRNCSDLTSVHISDLAAWCRISFGYEANPLSYTHNVYLNGALVTNLTIPDNVTSIGSFAFSGCSGLTSVTIPNSVTNIGEWAFSYCSGFTSVIIPDSVTRIGHFAFSDCAGLTSVTIPASVTSIGASAFYNCSGLTSVTIPASVTSIGASAFYNCSGLTSVMIPDGVTNIGSHAFEVCTGLTSLTIGSGVTSIGEGAFAGCSGLTNVVIGSGVSSIGSFAFEGCSGLTSMTIPNSVTNIGYFAFFDCSGLMSFTVSPSNPSYKSVSGLLLTKDGGTLIVGVNGDVTIPASVTSIWERAFYNCSGLTSVMIPDGVTNIGLYAFSGCSGLTSFKVSGSNPSYKSVSGLLLTKDGRTLVAGVNGDVTIPDCVTSIGDSAFSGYSGLTSVTIPNSVTSIGDWAFSDCSGIREVTVPQCVCTNGMSAVFSAAYQSITNVVISDGVTSIGASTFQNCSGLTSVTIPSSVTSISTMAFDGCGNLWTAWYRTLANTSAAGGCSMSSSSPSVSTTIVQQVESPYSLTDGAADRAIASVTVDADCAIDSFVLNDGKVYDSVLYVVNTATVPVRLSLPAGHTYVTVSGLAPLLLPASSTNLVTITRMAADTFLVTRQSLEAIK